MDIAFFVMLLLPLPFLFYMDEVQKGRYHSWYRIAEILLAVECIVFSGMNYFQLRGFADNILPIMACFLLFVLVVAGTILFDIFHGYIREYVVVAGMACI